MSITHYQMSIENYNNRYIQSKKFYKDNEKNNNYLFKTKLIKENETEE